MIFQWSDSSSFPVDAMAWIKSEAKKGTNEIGFVPWPRVEHDAAKGRVLVGSENGDLVTWALLGASKPVRCITQLWTRVDARRFHFAKCCVAVAEQRSIFEGVQSFRVQCAADIEGFKLWAACGFILRAMKKGGRSRGRPIGVFWKDFVLGHASLGDQLA